MDRHCLFAPAAAEDVDAVVAGQAGRPGTWMKIGADVHLTCADCGRTYMLDHVVFPDGEVRPRVVCPTRGCCFEARVVLDGWPRGAMTASPPQPDLQEGRRTDRRSRERESR